MTIDEIKAIASVLKPVIKAELESGSTGVGSLEVVSNLEGISSLPALRKRGAEITVVEAPVSLLKGEKGDQGDRGDDLEYKLLDSFPTLDALKTAYPEGTAEQGFFIAGDGMYVWNPKEETFREICLEVDKVFTSEVFSEVYPSGDRVTIDFSKTPYAKVTLGQDHLIYGLDIRNTREGSCGKVMVYQTGLRQLTMSERLRGTIDLPLNVDTIAILSYNCVGEYVYIHTSTVIGDKSYPVPQKVKDFQVTYSDSSSCTVQWTAPWANNIYDKGTIYDMRYANNLVEADDPKVWAGLHKVTVIPVPATPGTLQRMTISGLVPNKEYYLYLRTAKVNFGVEYSSPASDFAYFRTSGSEDMSKAYKIDLTERNLVPQQRNYNLDTDGAVCSIGRMVDEKDKNVYLPDGYPDMTNKGYTTFWSTYKYGRDTSPFDIVIDLYSPYILDRLFVYSRGKPRFSVFGMSDTGYPWERLGEIAIGYNEWKFLDLGSFRCRFLRLSFDLMDFGGVSVPPIPEGSEGFPEPEYNGTLDRIDNVALYGRPASTRPEGIMSPLRRSTARKTVDQFFCTNGHAYQQGRIHSMCSGEKMRMYMSLGQFAQFDQSGRLTPLDRLADMRFRVNQIPWISGNNGTGEFMEDNLRNTYRRYGLKPYICGTGVFDYCLYDRSFSVHNRPCDTYWYPGAWRPVPSRGVGGLERYFGVTMSASSYRTYAKLCQAVSAKYGKVKVDGNKLFWPPSESTDTGLDLISGIEPENEPDQGWSGWIGYTHPEEYASVISASADGHAGMLTDEDGNPLSGIRSGGILTVGSGTASVNRGYMLPAMLHWKATRTDATIPADVFSMHMYFSNTGNQGGSQEAVQYGITLEEALGSDTGCELLRMCALRDQFAPDKELWLTEFGWGESGARNTQSKYQCYSQPGEQIGNWIIPDRHRSDVKGARIVRASIQLMAMGFDMVNYYSTECENNYFGMGNWDSGAGFEMFHWNDCQDAMPGAKTEAIKSHECGYARGGFSTTGLFGQILGNGAYPITRAYWWVATFRNRLKNHVFVGMRHLERDSRIVVACFKDREKDKGAYVVYYNDNKNTGIEGVEIPVPAGVTTYKRVTVYVPDIPNPENVPNTLGWDKERTGLPTSRKERYVGGEWIIQNKPYYKDCYMSYAKAPADYPANPVEGDEITVLPTSDENPYFPVVGPIWAKASPHQNTLSAKQYEQDREEWQDEPQLDNDGNVIWTVKESPLHSWRQVDAVCDYIDFHPEGIHGRNGDEETREVIRGMIRANVSEFPEFYFFDAVPDTDYRSEVSNLSSRIISSSTIELWWNNTNVEDTGYEVFVSSLPETGYTLLKTVGTGIENKAVISGLASDATYYFKVRPVRGNKAGTLSGHVSARTFQDIHPPENLRVENRTATSIRLAWDYMSAQVPDFLGYAIYRSGDTGAYALVGIVDDQSIRHYEDKELAVGRVYRYKVRVLGINGMSVYTDETETRTLLPEEVTPIPRSVITDKLGSKVILSFDLPLGIVPATATDCFILTEDGNGRLIKSIYRDEANQNNMILSIPQDSLSDYDKRTDIRVSYDGKGGILSSYGVSLEGFTDMRVANVIGNFTNINATYQINLCAPGADVVEGWNNMAGEMGEEVTLDRLTDTYGRTSEVSLRKENNGTTLKWGTVVTGGQCEIAGVPRSVYDTLLGVAYGNNMTESVKSRLTFSGLDGECRYTVKAFGGTVYGAPTAIKMRIGNVYTPVIQQQGNKTDMLMIEDVAPLGGRVSIDFINPVEGLTSAYSRVAFITLEEYKPGDSPENTDVWLRGISILEDDGNGVVKSPDVTIHLNCIGRATHYRVGETGDLSSTPWIAIVDDTLDVPYSLSVGFGEKALSVQVRNPYAESNIRSMDTEYRDPYVPLVLRNIYVNGDASVTYACDVTVTIEMEGTPTYYRIAETSDLHSRPWLPWLASEVSAIALSLTPGTGQKTVYVQLMDSISVSAVKADSISYVELRRNEISISIVVPRGVDPASLEVSFPVLKYGKRMIFSYTADDGPIGAYGKVFRAVNGKWVDDEKHFHPGQERTSGYIPQKTLGYTDGCGVERRLPVGVAVWPNCGNTYNALFMEPASKLSRFYPYITWESIAPILDLGGSIYFHNMDEREFSPSDPVSIVEGLRKDQTKAREKAGRGIKVIMEPDGNHNYVTAGMMYEDVVMTWAQNIGNYLVPGEDPDLHKAVGIRRVSGGDNDADMAWLKEAHDSRSFEWCHLFTHNPGQEVIDLLTRVNDAYGKDGDDSAWMATVDEAYEYWFTRHNATISYEPDGNALRIGLSIPEGPMFYHKDLSIMISGIPDPGALTIEPGIGVIGISQASQGDGLLVNINYDASTLSRADKYTSLFEAGEDREDREDALYLLSGVLDGLAAPYLARLAAVAVPPRLESFTLDGSDPVTATAEVSCQLTYTGRATHMALSESPALEGASWVAIQDGAVPFTLQGTEGVHTVFCKLKNGHGESNTLGDSIEYRPGMPGPSKTVISWTGVPKQVSYPVHAGMTINRVSSVRHDTYPDLVLLDTTGKPSCILVVKLSAYPSMTILNDTLFAPAVDDSGPWPAEYINRHVCPLGKATPENPCGVKLSGLAPGKYRIRTLSSCSNGGSIPSGSYQQVFYSANGVTVNLPHDVVNNKDRFVELDNVEVGTDGILNMRFWQTLNLSYRPGINLVEIEKL